LTASTQCNRKIYISGLLTILDHVRRRCLYSTIRTSRIPRFVALNLITGTIVERHPIAGIGVEDVLVMQSRSLGVGFFFESVDPMQPEDLHFRTFHHSRSFSTTMPLQYHPYILTSARTLILRRIKLHRTQAFRTSVLFSCVFLGDPFTVAHSLPL
jgi:hypothetical protein